MSEQDQMAALAAITRRAALLASLHNFLAEKSNRLKMTGLEVCQALIHAVAQGAAFQSNEDADELVVGLRTLIDFYRKEDPNEREQGNPGGQSGPGPGNTTH